MRLGRHQTSLALASVLTVASFVGATAYTGHELMRLDALSATIATNAAPSLEYLGRTGARLERIRGLLHDAVERPGQNSHALNTVRAELHALDHDIESYLQLTPLPGERDLWKSTRGDLLRATRSTQSAIRASAEGDTAAAADLLRTQTNPAIDRAATTVLQTLEFDVKASERLAREILDLRRATTTQIVVLDILATLVALAAALVAFRFSREHDRLLQRHSALLEERVADLDRFAGRVAHDILSPLDAVGFGLALAAKSIDSPAHTHVERAQRSLQRVKQLVEGLLSFARAGAKRDTDARCAVDVVLANLASDWSERAREMGVTLTVEPCEHVEVNCSLGVLTSVVQNLTSNAIKYMGDRPTRRVTVRAHVMAERVRIEVADTGPGIPEEFRTRIFDPFVRGEHTTTDGAGLGLATVKRLVEAHGGSVVIDSAVGVGTTFKVTLPTAG